MEAKYKVILNIGIIVLLIRFSEMVIFKIWQLQNAADLQNFVNIHEPTINLTSHLFYVVSYLVFIYIIIRIGGSKAIIIFCFIHILFKLFQSFFIEPQFLNKNISIAQFKAINFLVLASLFLLGLVVTFSKSSFRPKLLVYGVSRMLITVLLASNYWLITNQIIDNNFYSYYIMNLVPLVDIYIFYMAKKHTLEYPEPTLDLVD